MFKPHRIALLKRSAARYARDPAGPVFPLLPCLTTQSDSMSSEKFSMFGTVAFGFVMTFSSGPGQTFFISLFNQDLRQAFSLSHGQIGSLYFAGTLTSALCIIWAGKLLDEIDLGRYTLMVCSGLTTAAVVMSFTNGPIMLAVAFFLLRLFGQGLSGHTGITTASRAPRVYRGRAISYSGLGFSAAEILMPVITVSLLSIYSWREVWRMVAGFELFIIVLASQYLLSHYRISNHPVGQNITDNICNSWTRRQVTRDPRFWLIAPAIFAPSVISTGLFFHQQNLAQHKGFTFPVWASAIAAYSITAVLTSLLTGTAVDRWSGARVVKFYLLPFIAAVLIATYLHNSALPFIYYALMGMTVGIATPSVSALWIELYGTAHIASIRSLTHAMMVVGTALGPVIFGTLLDANFSWEFILICCAAWMSVATLLLSRPSLTYLSVQNS